MTSIQAYKVNKEAQIKQKITQLEQNYSKSLQEELRERNTGKVNTENIAKLTAELAGMNQVSGKKKSDAYSPESFM